MERRAEGDDSSSPYAAHWMTLRTAAAHLDLKPAALRRALERRATRAGDGGVVAQLDGVIARKLGCRWRVRFSNAWLAERP